MKLVDPAPYVMAILGLTALVWNLFGPRPKRPARPVRRVSARAVHSLAAPPWFGARGLPSGVPPRT